MVGETNGSTEGYKTIDGAGGKQTGTPTFRCGE